MMDEDFVMPKKIAVLGAGAWGITLANLLAQGGMPVLLWARTADAAGEINGAHRSSRLHDIPLHPDLRADTDAGRVLKGADAVVSVVVSHNLRAFLRDTARDWPRDALVLSATKGLERETCKRMTQVFADELPDLSEQRIAVLSGPNLAGEIAQNKPASTVVACRLEKSARYFQRLFHSDSFRVYTNRDVVGLELGGAIKNVIAIAAGMCRGLQLGDNSIAALATRGIAEIKRLGVKMGASGETFSGLAGFGDVVVTCCSQSSRNRRLGEEIGGGKPPQEAIKANKTVAEGVHTVAALYKLSREMGIPLPICEAVYKVLFEAFPAARTVGELMRREAKPE